MAVRRLAENQPESFEFTPDNLAWAKEQLNKYPEGREHSAIIPVLWRAQEQHDGWLPEPAIRYVADMLNMPYIRALEIATFYTMFQLQPVGKKAHIQLCGTTPCMLRGSEELKAVCKKKIAAKAHQLSDDGNFSWEEVECLGACVNAPMVQIFKDTYEDLTPGTFEKLIDDIAAGKAVTPGPQSNRHFSMPENGLTSLTEIKDAGNEGGKPVAKIVEGSAAAIDSVAGYAINDNGKKAGGIKLNINIKKTQAKPDLNTKSPEVVAEAEAKSITHDAAREKAGRPSREGRAEEEAARSHSRDEDKPSLNDASRPAALDRPRDGKADDLQAIRGIGPKIELTLNDLGIYHYDQIANLTHENIDWIDGYLKFKGRIGRENWIEQAKELSGKAGA
jgi:NADH-quinone oxidoreductase subunit E